VNSTKQQIADTFERHVARVGYAKATLDDVAREMRISKKTIYVHFDGKRDIYSHVVDRQAAAERLRLQAAVSVLSTRRERIEALLRFVLGQAREHIAETSEDEWMQEYEVAADAFRKAHGDLLRDIVADGIANGEFAPGSAELVEKMVAAMVLEYLVIVNGVPGFDHDDELIERTLRFIG